MVEWGTGLGGQAVLAGVELLEDDAEESDEVDVVLLELLVLPESDDELDEAAGLLLLDAARESVR